MVMLFTLMSCGQSEQKHTGTISDAIETDKITGKIVYKKTGLDTACISRKVKPEDLHPRMEGVPVGEENFNKLVAFIEKHGSVVVEKGVPCDHQYTFIDSRGNEHFMITVKEDKVGNHSAKGEIKRIRVLAFKNENKDGHKDGPQFEYLITEKSVVSTFLSSGTSTDDVKFGYEEFLAKVSKPEIRSKKSKIDPEEEELLKSVNEALNK